jgi:transcriptional antiterminator NusG
MSYYVFQVRTGHEQRAREIAGKEIGPYLSLHWPRRELEIRRRGKKRREISPIFPGYLFLEADTLGNALYWQIRHLPGFIRFLEDNHNVRPLKHDEERLLLHFLGFGEVVERSRVRFDENSRIEVLAGPLKGLEGRIVKVDKRKKRAKVRLDLYEDTFLIDFGFEDISPAHEETVREGT